MDVDKTNCSLEPARSIIKTSLKLFILRLPYSLSLIASVNLKMQIDKFDRFGKSLIKKREPERVRAPRAHSHCTLLVSLGRGDRTQPILSLELYYMIALADDITGQVLRAHRRRTFRTVSHYEAAILSLLRPVAFCALSLEKIIELVDLMQVFTLSNKGRDLGPSMIEGLLVS